MKSVWVVVFAVVSLWGAQLRIGSSSFDWDMRIAGFMKGGAEMDLHLLSIANVHDNFSDSRWYYSYDVDLMGSDFVDRMTTLASYPLTYRFPLFGSLNDAIGDYTMIAVPSEYKIRGLDLDFAIGYDLVRTESYTLSAGINTGFSMPVMKMRNLKKTAQMTYTLLERTDTKVRTWKLGPQVQIQVPIDSDFTFFGLFAYGIQKGSLRNDWFRSEMDIDGSYSVWDLNLRYTPWHRSVSYAGITITPQLYLSIGYRQKQWHMDDMQVDMADILHLSTMGTMKVDMRDSAYYFGIGYDF